MPTLLRSVECLLPTTICLFFFHHMPTPLPSIECLLFFFQSNVFFLPLCICLFFFLPSYPYSSSYHNMSALLNSIIIGLLFFLPSCACLSYRCLPTLLS